MTHNSPIIISLTWKSVVRPMRMTFATSRGSKTCIRSVIVKAVCSDGSVGAGEVPTSFLLPNETIEAIKSVLTTLKPKLIGQPVCEWSSRAAGYRKQFADFPMTCSGLEIALFRAFLAGYDKSELN